MFLKLSFQGYAGPLIGKDLSGMFVRGIHKPSAKRLQDRMDFKKAVLLDQLLMSGMFKDEAQVSAWLTGDGFKKRAGKVYLDAFWAIGVPLAHQYPDMWQMCQVFVDMRAEFRRLSLDIKFLNHLFGADWLAKTETPTLSEQGIKRLLPLVTMGKEFSQLSTRGKNLVKWLASGDYCFDFKVHPLFKALMREVEGIRSAKAEIIGLTYDSRVQGLEEFTDFSRKLGYLSTNIYGKRRLTRAQMARVTNARVGRALILLVQLALSKSYIKRYDFSFSSNLKVVMEIDFYFGMSMQCPYIFRPNPLASAKRNFVSNSLMPKGSVNNSVPWPQSSFDLLEGSKRLESLYPRGPFDDMLGR